MPDFDDSLGGHTLGDADNEDRFDKSLGDQHTMGGDTDVNSLGDASTLGDANIEDDWGGDDMELVDLSARYTEEGVLGKGGMGEVLLATDTRLDRKVAIKRIVGKAARSKTASQRFLTEAKSIAALNHNNIVQIYDYGRSTAGPFLIMECVQGGSLLDKCKEGPIELEEAVNIFSQLCDGLAKAHAANIIHRDIKPANVLMTEDGVPKLTDFGLAKDDTADTGMTMQGAVIGTLDFMPPEQREGAHLTDHRSDLWSLAATFYQMLTGKSPKIIKFSDVPAKLQDVLGKALEDYKDDRYQSALEMREAILKAHSGKVDTSRTLGEGECPECGVLNPRDRKFCRECTAKLQVPCLKCQVLIPIWDKGCGECGALQQPLVDEKLEELQAYHDRAELHLQELAFEQATETASKAVGQEDPRLQTFVVWHEEFTGRLQQTRDTEHERLKEILLEAIAHEEAYDYQAGLRVMEQVAPSLLDTAIDGVNDTASELKGRLEKNQSRLKELEQIVRERVKRRELSGLLPLVDELLSLKPGRLQVESLKTQLVSREEIIAERNKETVAKAKQYIRALRFEEVINALNSLTGDERTGEIESLVQQASAYSKLRQIALEQRVVKFKTSTYYRRASSRIANYLGEIAKQEIEDPKIKLLYDQVKAMHSAALRKEQFIKLGIGAVSLLVVLITVVIMRADHNAKTIEAALIRGDWKAVLELDPGNKAGVRLKSAAEQTAIKASLAKGDWQAVLVRDPKHVVALQLKVAADRASAVPDTPKSTSVNAYGRPVNSIAFNADGKGIVWGGNSGKSVMLSATGTSYLNSHKDKVAGIDLSPDGKIIATASWDSTIKLWDSQSGAEIKTLSGHKGNVVSVAFSPDGKTLASGGSDRAIKLWDIQSNTVQTLTNVSRTIMCVTFSIDGKVIASGDTSAVVRLWDRQSGDEIKTLKGHKGYIMGVTFNPDGKTIASASADWTIKLWDIQSNTVQTLAGHQDVVTSVAYSPDGKTIASASQDKSIKLWDSQSGAEIKMLTGHMETVTSVAYSPDGKTIASASLDGTVKLWDVSALTEP